MRKGFTLVEFIIYTAIVAVVLVAALRFTWIIMQDQIKQTIAQEVQDSGAFALQTIEYYLKRAEAINPQTVFASHPGLVNATLPDGTLIVFDTYTREINGQTIRTLRLTRGAGDPSDLTSDRVTVSNFVITNLSSDTATAVRLALTLQSINIENLQAYAAQDSWTSSITLRPR